MILQNPSTFDVQCSKRTVYGEARGEDYQGKVAVSHVILNRARKKNTSPAKECLRYKQFSCWNYNDPNSSYIMAVSDNATLLLECERAFLEALSNARAGEDFTLGSCHYHTKAITIPYWARGHSPVLEVGNHLFYNDIRF